MTQPNTVDIADVVEGQKTLGFFTLSLFVMCALVLLADGFDNQALNYAAPAIVREWGINRALMTPVFNVSVLGWMTGALTFSMIADWMGRRNAILLAVFLFGAGTFAIPLADNLYELAALRFFATIGVGGAMPMAIALISDYSKAKNRGMWITLLYVGYTTGSSGGGFIAAELIQTYGWRSVFYFGGVVAMVVLALLIIFLPESARYLLLKGGSRERVAAYVKKLRPDTNYDAATNFVIQEPGKKGKGLPVKDLFLDGRSTMTIALWMALGFSFVTHFFLSQWLTTLMSDRMELPDAVRTQALFQAGAFFGFIFGWLIDKKGINVITWVMVLGVPPVIALGLVDAGTVATWVISFIAGVLVLGGNIGLNAISGSIYPTFIRSTGTGAAFAVARVGAILGPMLTGLLIYLETPFEWIFILGALPLLPAAVAGYMLSRTVELPKHSVGGVAHAHAR